MMNKPNAPYRIVCSVCGKKLPSDAWWRSECGNSTRVMYDTYTAQPQFPLNIPIVWDTSVGNTPLIKLNTLSSLFGCQIYAKCENQNPTGSFKDRGSLIEIQKAIELGKKGIVCASTGNMAISLSARAAQANIACIDVIPRRTSNLKLELMKRCGGQTILIDGSYDDCVGQAQQYAQSNDYFLCGDYTLRREGQKIIGWELAASSIAWDACIIPVGNGNLGTAIYQGWQEAKPDTTLPSFIGVQPALCDPLTCAWNTKSSIIPQSPKIRTNAAAFDVGNPLDGPAIVHLIKKTDGCMVSISDADMLRGQTLLAQKEGILTDITVGASIATIEKLQKKFANKTVVIIISGSGLSDALN